MCADDPIIGGARYSDLRDIALGIDAPHSAPAPRDAESEPRPVYASAEHPAETSEIWAAIAAWANASTGEAEIEAANRINAHLAAARTEIAAQSAEVARLREANAALEADAERWHFMKRYLSVEQDYDCMGEYLFMDDALCSIDTVADGFDNTVDSLIDQARAARPPSQPPEQA